MSVTTPAILATFGASPAPTAVFPPPAAAGSSTQIEPVQDVTPVTGSDVSNAGLSPAPPQITLNISPKVSITSSQYLGPYSSSEVKVVEEEEEEEREEEKGTRGQRKAKKRPLSPDSEKEKKLKKRMQNIRSREQRKAKQARELEELEHGSLKLQADRERFEQERAQFEARVHDMTRYDARCVSCGGHVCPVVTVERGTSPGPTLSSDSGNSNTMQLHSSGTCDPLITISERDYLDLIAKCNALEAWMKGCYPVKNSAHDHSSLSTAQIEYVDLSLAYTQITALVQNLTKFQSERDSAKSQAEADRAKWTLAQTELAEIQSQLLEVDSERTSLEQQLHHTNLDREALESRLAQMQELQDHFDVANAELVDLRTASTTVVNEHDHLRHLLNATKSKLASGSSYTDSSITIFDHDSMTAKVARLKHRLQVSEAELVAVKDELRTYQSTTSALSLDRAVAVSSNSPVDTTDGFSALHHALDKIKSLAAEFGSSEL